MFSKLPKHHLFFVETHFKYICKYLIVKIHFFSFTFSFSSLFPLCNWDLSSPSASFFFFACVTLRMSVRRYTNQETIIIHLVSTYPGTSEAPLLCSVSHEVGGSENITLSCLEGELFEIYPLNLNMLVRTQLFDDYKCPKICFHALGVLKYGSIVPNFPSYCWTRKVRGFV